MLTLDSRSVRAHWAAADPSLAQLFDAIEQTEDWVVDQAPPIAMRLNQLALALNGPGAAAALEQMDRGRLLFVFVYMSTSKAIRLLQWLDEQHEGMGARLLNALLDSNGPALRAGLTEQTLVRTLAQRMRVLQNTRFFHSVFDPQVLSRLAVVITQQREDAQHA